MFQLFIICPNNIVLSRNIQYIEKDGSEYFHNLKSFSRELDQKSYPAEVFPKLHERTSTQGQSKSINSPASVWNY